MSVCIKRKQYNLAVKSLSNLYAAEFKTNNIDNDIVKGFSKDETIERYAKTLQFWKDHTPFASQDMSEFTIAKHAVCTNAISQLWKRIDELDIRKEITSLDIDPR